MPCFNVFGILVSLAFRWEKWQPWGAKCAIVWPFLWSHFPRYKQLFSAFSDVSREGKKIPLFRFPFITYHMRRRNLYIFANCQKRFRAINKKITNFEKIMREKCNSQPNFINENLSRIFFCLSKNFFEGREKSLRKKPQHKRHSFIRALSALGHKTLAALAISSYIEPFSLYKEPLEKQFIYIRLAF